MFKIATIKDIDNIRGKFDANVISECKRLAKIFDDNYNCVSMYGDCAIIVENTRDLEVVRQEYVDYTNTPYEFADIIPNSEYISVLFIPATEYAINLIIPKSITPTNIIYNVN